MDHTPNRPACTQEAARLLPWWVNGTLSEADARRVAEHLEQCASCRDDATELGLLRQQLRTPAQVEHAPHAGFQKLLARVDAAERNDAIAPTAPQGARGGRVAVRWLSAAVVVQALALATIGGSLLWRRPAVLPLGEFRTLSTPRDEAAALRVVFAPTTTLAELQELLRANHLTLLAGPTEAGIVTLALHGPGGPNPERLEALARLRSDPRVRFAEPVGDDAGTGR